MYIYNTTYFVEENILTNWIDWLKSKHITEMEKHHFSHPQIAKVLSTDLEQDRIAISVQFSIQDIALLNEWKNKHFSTLQSEITQIFGEKVLPFDTVLEVIHKQ